MPNTVLAQIQATLAPYNCQLIAVSKTKPSSMIQDLYDQGQRAFGENRVQEIVEKQPQLPQDIDWHFIGHLQSNKVKYIAPFVHYIHAVDSWKLLQEINKRALQNDRCIHVLLQFKIAEESTKHGYSSSDILDMLRQEAWQELNNIRICGVMGMATFTDNKEQVKREFTQLKKYFDLLKEEFFSNTDHFKEISMGMSGDYPIALEAGSTMVRIGSLLFGARG